MVLSPSPTKVSCPSMAIIDTSGFDAAATAIGDDDEDTAHLQAMHEDALRYIQSHEWAEPIRETYLAFGVGKVIAVFLFDFLEPVAGLDQQLWVVVGDLPPAYFVTARARIAARDRTSLLQQHTARCIKMQARLRNDNL
jgi:hypothetical protein